MIDCSSAIEFDRMRVKCERWTPHKVHMARPQAIQGGNYIVLTEVTWRDPAAVQRPIRR